MEPQLETILAELGISQYLPTFVEQGFDTWDTILEITESDLDALQVKLGHRRKLQKRIANSRGPFLDGGVGSPLSTRMSIEDRYDAPRLDASKAAEVKNAGVTKRKYRRHPKPDTNAPERPPSAYVLFSNKMREDLKGRNLTFTEIAKLVGENWQSLTPQEKEPYETQAQQAKEAYNNHMAEYKKTPEYRQYNQYLQEFKLKHASSNSQNKDAQKRPRLEAGLTTSLQSNMSHSGSTSSSVMGGSSSRGNGSGTSSQHTSEPPPSRHALRQGSSSAASTPITFGRNADEPLVSPGSHSGFFEPMDHSPKVYPADAPPPGHRPSNSMSWKESGTLLPSLSDVFDASSQPFGPSSSDGCGYPGFRHAPHRSGLGPGPPGSAHVQSDSRPPPFPIGLRKENSSAGSISSSGNTSGSNSTCGSSGQGSASSISSYGRSSLDGGSSLPIHALLRGGGSSRYDSPMSTSSSTCPQSPPNDRPTYPHRQVSSRTSNSMGPAGLDFRNGETGFQTPPQLPGLQPSHITNVRRHQDTAEDPGQLCDGGSKEESGGLDGMSALLRAGEIVDRRNR